MLEIQDTALILIDVQEKLARVMNEKDRMVKNVQILIRSCNMLEIPVIWCEQVPKALGSTLPEIAELLDGNQPIEKSSFSCWGEEGIKKTLQQLAKNNILICGIEAHVCVYQTAMDLNRFGFTPQVVSDATTSRTEQNMQMALKRLASEGIAVTGTEMVLFELLKTAKHPKFKEIATFIK